MGSKALAIESRGGLLGVEIGNVTEELATSLGVPANKGVVVGQVLEEGAANKAGIRRGDVILALNDEPIKSSAHLVYLIDSQAPGSTVILNVFRNNEAFNVKVSMGERSTSSFDHALLKYRHRDGTPFAMRPPTTTPREHGYFLFDGKIYVQHGSLVVVELLDTRHDLGRYWAFEIPDGTNFTPRKHARVRVIVEIVDTLRTRSVAGTPLYAVVVRPVAIGDGEGQLVYDRDKRR